MYTIDKLAKITGLSKRTLRFYEETGLLENVPRSESGYRLYGKKEVDRLQQILFYKALGFSLEEIKKAIFADAYDFSKALKKQRAILLEKKLEIDQLLNAVEMSLKNQQGEMNMSDEEKFTALKKAAIKENEEKYGEEIRQKYGDDVIDKSNKKYANLTKEDMTKLKELEEDLFLNLAKVRKSHSIPSPEAKKAFEDHRMWLNFSWPSYSKEAHRGLAEMYVADERFAKYYNDKGEGNALLLKEIIDYYAK